MTPDDQMSLLRAVQQDANALLAQSGTGEWTAYWPRSVPVDTPTLALFFEHKRLRVTMFVTIPSSYVWEYATESRARDRLRLLLREQIDRMTFERRPDKGPTPPPDASP